MSWPPYDEPFGLHALEAMEIGQELVYIGEWNGCTGTADMHVYLDQNFRDVDVHIPWFTFLGLHDRVYVMSKEDNQPVLEVI